MKILAHTRLYFTEGRSDKEYHVELAEVADRYVVNFRFGRRCGTLTSGTKTATPVDLAHAQSLYDRLVKDKTAKGYTPDGSGAADQKTEHAGRQTGFMPQLLNPITEFEAILLLANDSWAAQEKMDGERRMAEAVGGQVTGANRKGLSVPLPQGIADELLAIDAAHGALRVDGEIIVERLHVFDLHVLNGQAIDHLPWIERMRQASRILNGCRFIKAIPVAETTDDKRRLWDQVKSAHGEGIVFKRADAPVSPGRPNSGGDWLKFKFTASASCYVAGINGDKRSVRLGMIESRDHPIQGQGMVSVGNVTIPPNRPLPKVGDIIEVAYLYAYPGGSLYQPVFLCPRTDLEIDTCSTRQLKYKPEGRDDDEA